jgi:hypothetical protein
MWIVVGAVVLVLVAVVAVLAMRRPRADDLHSVRSYHSALGTLETFADRMDQSPPEVVAQADRSSEGHVRPRFYSRATADAPAAPDGSPVDPGDVERAGGRASTPHPGIPPSIPPVPTGGSAELPDPGVPLRFDDAPPIDHQRRGAGLPAQGLRMDRAQRHALDSMNHRPRRITTVMIVVAALVLFGVLAYVGSRRTGSTNHGHAVATATTTGRSTTSHPAQNHRGGGATKHEHKVSPTTTTVPKQIVALTSTPTSATYPVGEATYKVTLNTTGPCWVQAITVETGSTLWEGTLQAGQVQVIPASGPVTVELGASAATLKIDNIPVVLPVPLHTPFVARFQPSTPTPTGTGNTTTTVPSITSNGSTPTTTASGPGV